jgi:hypothetical protein
MKITPSSFDEFRTERAGKIILLCFPAIIVVCLAITGSQEGHRAAAFSFLSGMLILVLPHLVVITHELGHVLMAWLVGVRVQHVEVGVGRTMFAGRIGGVPWTVHWIRSVAARICGTRPGGGYGFV